MGSNRMTGLAMESIHQTLADLQFDLELLDLRLARHVVLAGDSGGEREESCTDSLPTPRQRDDGVLPQKGTDRSQQMETRYGKRQESESLERNLIERRSGNRSNVEPTRLDELSRALGLTEFEAAVVALCLVLEIDPTTPEFTRICRGTLPGEIPPLSWLCR